jgi:hypothetical protein
MGGSMMDTVLTIAMMIVVVAIGLALVIGVALVVGWILTLFLPFSLFEATLLSMLAIIVGRTIWSAISSSVEPRRFDYDEDDEEADLEEPDEIPSSRFYRTDADRTWENWFRYILANATYEDFLDLGGFAQMNDRQLQELSIRLTDAAISGLKIKSPRTKRLRVSKGMLKHEMTKMGQQPYDDDILDAAIDAINDELGSLQRELREVIRGKLWNEAMDMY